MPKTRVGAAYVISCLSIHSCVLYRTHRSSIILYISIIFLVLLQKKDTSGIVITQEEEDYDYGFPFLVHGFPFLV